MKLSIIIPVYNEHATVRRVVEEVQATDFEKEIIIVDDGSTDGSADIIRALAGGNITALFHERNRGKGAALRTAIGHIHGDIVIIQDADLEYHPDEYPLLIGPILKNRADVVFGSRFIGAHRCFLFTHYVGNKIVNFIANILYNTILTDFMTCYKAFKHHVITGITLNASRFGIEAEITGEIFKRNWRVYEVPISYSGRDYHEGKKIRWTDFFVVIWWLFKTRVRRREASEGFHSAGRPE